MIAYNKEADPRQRPNETTNDMSMVWARIDAAFEKGLVPNSQDISIVDHFFQERTDFYNQAFIDKGLISQPLSQVLTLRDEEIQQSDQSVIIGLRHKQNREHEALKFSHEWGHRAILELSGFSTTQELLNAIEAHLKISPYDYDVPSSLLGARNWRHPEFSIPPLIFSPKNQDIVVGYFGKKKDGMRDLAKTVHDIICDVWTVKHMIIYRTQSQIDLGITAEDIYAKQVASEIRENDPEDTSVYNADDPDFDEGKFIRTFARFAAISKAIAVMRPDRPKLEHRGESFDKCVRVVFERKPELVSVYEALVKELEQYAIDCFNPQNAHNGLEEKIRHHNPHYRAITACSMAEGKQLHHLQTLSLAAQNEQSGYVKRLMQLAMIEIACTHENFQTKEAQDVLKQLLRMSPADDTRRIIKFIRSLTNRDEVYLGVTLLSYAVHHNIEKTLIHLGQQRPDAVKAYIRNAGRVEYGGITTMRELEENLPIAELSMAAAGQNTMRHKDASRFIIGIAKRQYTSACNMASQLAASSIAYEQIIGIHALSLLGIKDPVSIITMLEELAYKGSQAVRYRVIEAVANIAKGLLMAGREVPDEVYTLYEDLATKYQDDTTKFWVINHLIGLSRDEDRADRLFYSLMAQYNPATPDALPKTYSKAEGLMAHFSYVRAAAKLYGEGELDAHHLILLLQQKPVQGHSRSIFRWIARRYPESALDLLEYAYKQIHHIQAHNNNSGYRYRVDGFLQTSMDIIGIAAKYDTDRAWSLWESAYGLSWHDESYIDLIKQLRHFRSESRALARLHEFTFEGQHESVRVAATHALTYFVEEFPTETFQLLEDLLAKPKHVIQHGVIRTFIQIGKGNPNIVVDHFQKAIRKHETVEEKHTNYYTMNRILAALPRFIKVQPGYRQDILRMVNNIMMIDPLLMAECFRCLGKIARTSAGKTNEDILDIFTPYVKYSGTSYTQVAADAICEFASIEQMQRLINTHGIHPYADTKFKERIQLLMDA